MIYAKQIPPKPVVQENERFIDIMPFGPDNTNKFLTGTNEYKYVKLPLVPNIKVRFTRYWSVALETMDGGVIDPSPSIFFTISNEAGTDFLLGTAGVGLSKEAGRNFPIFSSTFDMNEPLWFGTYNAMVAHRIGYLYG